MKESLLIPRQPFMPMLTNTYYKKVMNQYGISHFYTFIVKKGITEISTSIPDCCIDIMFYWNKSRSSIGANIVGSLLSPHGIQVKEGYEYFGIRFMPGEIPSNMNLLLGEAIEQSIPLKDFIDDSGLIERIAMAQNFQERIQIYMNYYEPLYQTKEIRYGKEELNRYIIYRILTNQGNIKIGSLAEDSGYSGRYITTVFAERNGITPKQFCEIIRFQNMVQEMEGEQNMDILYKLGFYDQSHFCNVFKRYSGRSPQEFMKELKQEKFNERLKVIV